jgi:hypothetical protein
MGPLAQISVSFNTAQLGFYTNKVTHLDTLRAFCAINLHCLVLNFESLHIRERKITYQLSRRYNSRYWLHEASCVSVSALYVLGEGWTLACINIRAHFPINLTHTSPPAIPFYIMIMVTLLVAVLSLAALSNAAAYPRAVVGSGILKLPVSAVTKNGTGLLSKRQLATGLANSQSGTSYIVSRRNFCYASGRYLNLTSYSRHRYSCATCRCCY